MSLASINIKFNVTHHLDFGKIKTGLILEIFMVGFSDILDIGWVEDIQMIKDKQLDGKELIKDVNDRFDDYSISPKIRQILLHWR